LRAAGLLAQMGFTSVVDMRGGFDGERTPAGQVTVEGWSSRGLEVSTAAESGRSYLELLAATKGS
jgi:rhodanese-related sulfurtransferase